MWNPQRTLAVLTRLLTIVVVAVLGAGCAQPAPSPAGTRANPAAADPLPSWNDGATKRAILDLVKAVTTDGSPDFVPVPERIATFDNDGTLWAEQPIYVQLLFAFDRIRAMAPITPSGNPPSRTNRCSRAT